MDDLISRQAVIDLLKKNTTRDIEEVVVTEKNIKLIMDMPKAFDVDAVVEAMEEWTAKYDCRYCKHYETGMESCGKDCTDSLIESLIDIVKAGGRNAFD